MTTHDAWAQCTINPTNGGILQNDGSPCTVNNNVTVGFGEAIRGAQQRQRHGKWRGNSAWIWDRGPRRNQLHRHGQRTGDPGRARNRSYRACNRERPRIGCRQRRPHCSQWRPASELNAAKQLRCLLPVTNPTLAAVRLRCQQRAIGPLNSVPIRNANRKTAEANILNVCRRAVPAQIDALHRTLTTDHTLPGGRALRRGRRLLGSKQKSFARSEYCRF